MAKRAGVIDRYAPLERRGVVGVAVSTCNGGKNQRPFALSWTLGHTHTSYLKSTPILFDMSGNQIIQLLLNGHALRQRV